MRTVTPRDERKGNHSCRLWGYVDEGGPQMDGQDLGPGG